MSIDANPTEEYQRDPYANVAVQKEATRQYATWPFQLISIIFLAILLVMITLASKSGWIAAISLLVFGYGLVGLFHHLTCDEQGIIVHFWLRSHQRIDWANIRSAQITYGRGIAICHLHIKGVSGLTGISFRVANLKNLRARIGERDILFRTIQVRAGLRLVKRTFLGALIYECQDSA